MGAKRSDEVWDPLFDNRTDRQRAAEVPRTPQTEAPAYRLAFADDDFLCREELRPVRLQLELLKPEILLSERGIRSTVVMFGGARIPAPGTDAWAAKNETQRRNLTSASKYYEEARKFARICSRHSAETGNREFVIVTGGGPGVMEAGNLGASQESAPSIGLNIILPHEQAPNEHVTPELCFNFHYFAVRKMHFLMRAKAISVFPGGFGTLDEMFEALTLIQTGRMEPLPFILFGADFWHKVIDFQELADFGTISPADLELFNFVETAGEAWDIIAGHYGI
ncbi:LOG family protein [Hoeflea poritis]|uniref:AMP nucleosidase n=1 Tax=Hoeflea poritis TaxID=2993659 RepID=A0ABT4VNK5_9HYPH|nr:LOG family protein [Hoeflea poritis]MDA4846269.1 LOG family protein [Hoeflea poritis]